MKKKKIIVICLIVSIIILFLGGLLFYQKILSDKKKVKEERISFINDTYGNYANGTKLECTDKICMALDYNIDLHEKINSLEVTSLDLKEINDIDGSLDTYQTLKDEIINWQYKDINKYLKNMKPYEKKALLNIYEHSNITKSIENDLVIKDKVLEQVDRNLDILNFLVENDANFISDNYRIIYINDNFRREFLGFNLDIPLFSIEEAYGKRVPILTYHGVDDNIWGNASLFVKPSEFERQMKYLSDNGYHTYFLSEIGNAVHDDKPVILTFDDGYLDMYTIAYPIMKKYGLKSNMFIISGWLDGSTYMSAEMVKELSRTGLVEIGSHTVSHVHLNALSYDEQEKELKDSKLFLEELIGKEVNTIAYPYGQRNRDTLAIAKQYYRYAVTTESGANYAKTYNGLSLILKRFNMQRGTSFESFKSFVG